MTDPQLWRARERLSLFILLQPFEVRVDQRVLTLSIGRWRSGRLSRSSCLVKDGSSVVVLLVVLGGGIRCGSEGIIAKLEFGNGRSHRRKVRVDVHAIVGLCRRTSRGRLVLVLEAGCEGHGRGRVCC